MSEEKILRCLYGLQHESTGVTRKAHRHFLKTVPNCFSAKHAIDWLLAHDTAKNYFSNNRRCALALLKLLEELKAIVNPFDSHVMADDNHMYTFSPPNTLNLRASCSVLSPEVSLLELTDGALLERKQDKNKGDYVLLLDMVFLDDYTLISDTPGLSCLS